MTKEEEFDKNIYLIQEEIYYLCKLLHLLHSETAIPSDVSEFIDQLPKHEFSNYSVFSKTLFENTFNKTINNTVFDDIPNKQNKTIINIISMHAKYDHEILNIFNSIKYLLSCLKPPEINNLPHSQCEINTNKIPLSNDSLNNSLKIKTLPKPSVSNVSEKSIQIDFHRSGVAIDKVVKSTPKLIKSPLKKILTTKHDDNELTHDSFDQLGSFELPKPKNAIREIPLKIEDIENQSFDVFDFSQSTKTRIQSRIDKSKRSNKPRKSVTFVDNQSAQRVLDVETLNRPLTREKIKEASTSKPVTTITNKKAEVKQPKKSLKNLKPSSVYIPDHVSYLIGQDDDIAHEQTGFTHVSHEISLTNYEIPPCSSSPLHLPSPPVSLPKMRPMEKFKNHSPFLDVNVKSETILKTTMTKTKRKPIRKYTNQQFLTKKERNDIIRSFKKTKKICCIITKKCPSKPRVETSSKITQNPKTKSKIKVSKTIKPPKKTLTQSKTLKSRQNEPKRSRLKRKIINPDETAPSFLVNS